MIFNMIREWKLNPETTSTKKAWKKLSNYEQNTAAWLEALNSDEILMVVPDVSSSV